jgi:hypothetical protein
MLEAGEDARFVARRLLIAASEDIGLADPTALMVADAAARAVEYVGLPEARINLAHATVHLALAPKSNSAYAALGRAVQEVRSGPVGEVPTPFPILVDGDRTLSEGLGLFTTDWGGSTADQNVPTILIIDSQGVLQFKYMSQNTIDRPPLEYLVQVVDVLNGMGG